MLFPAAGTQSSASWELWGHSKGEGGGHRLLSQVTPLPLLFDTHQAFFRLTFLRNVLALLVGLLMQTAMSSNTTLRRRWEAHCEQAVSSC